MPYQKPKMYLFAGPNGSGKSSYLSKQVPNETIIFDPDKIARQLAEAKGLSPEEAQEAVYNDNAIKIEAMRKLMEEMKDALKNGLSFATETALNKSKTYKNLIAEAHEDGYKVHLWYVGTESAEINMDRVNMRVDDKGHGVPYKDVVKRYEGSLESLKKFTDIADEVRIYDNSITGDDIEPKLMLCIENGKTIYEAPEKTMPRWIKENMYYSPEVINELQVSRKEAISITQELTGAEIITDAVQGKSYDGKILATTDKYVIQQSAQLTKHGEPIIVFHRKEDLSAELSPGDNVMINARGEATNLNKSPMPLQEIYAAARDEFATALGPEGIVTKARNDVEYTGKVIGFAGEHPNKVAALQISDTQAVMFHIGEVQEAALRTDDELIITSHGDSIDSLKVIEAETRHEEIEEDIDCEI